MTHSDACPSAESLRSHAQGTAGAPDVETLKQHVSTCDKCKGILRQYKSDTHDVTEETTAHTTDWSERSGPLPADDEATDDIRVVLSRLEAAEAEDELARVQHYRLLQVLGVGGMGIVFLAEDCGLGRKVAIKTMRPTASRSARERFLREAQATAAIDHENVVDIYQVGECGGVPFIAMPLLRGESLKDRLMRVGRFDEETVVRVGRQIADGLGAAHVRGLIHRDIKPANIWLEEGRDRAKIVDFGLVRNEQATELTRTGQVLGTPKYMAPEQARGEPTDARTDLYSLGAVLYHLAAGQPPFDGGSLTAVLISVVNEPPKPLANVSPETSRQLVNLIDTLLAKDPRDRPQSASAVSKELTAIERGLAETALTIDYDKNTASEPPAKDAAVPAGGGQRLWIGAATVVAIAALAGFQFLQGTQETPPADTNIVTERESPGPVSDARSGSADAPTANVATRTLPKITSLRAVRFRDIGERFEEVGGIGAETSHAAEQENVKVHVQFEEPAYCYLIAFNPNGGEQLCYPTDSDQPPEKQRSLEFPDADYFFGLTDGPGQQVFVVVASHQPLPSFDQWRELRGDAPWAPPTAPTEVRRFSEGKIRVPTSRNVRGDIRRAGDSDELKALCQFLDKAPQVEQVSAIAFPVSPVDGGGDR